ncbi:MAG: alpha/beta hydrolase [Betaproteobacteria bacterium]|nr:alpha/beta hydrolase [Betaproteobacteria bacterium]
MKRDVPRREVILVHGLWVPGVVMWPIAARLAHAGYIPRVFGYAGRQPIERSIERLARYAHVRCGGRTCAFVGHSLGAVLVLEALNRRRDIALASAVLLAPPVNGCLAARRFGATRLGHLMLGASASLWSEGRSARWLRDAPLGVIAGTRSFGLGHLFGPLPGANDGVVRLDETRVEDATEHLSVPLSHSLMVVSRHAAALVTRFLASGRFAERDGCAEEGR